MDYYVLADELIQMRASVPQIQLDRVMSKMVKGEQFVLNYLFSHENSAYPKELSRGMIVSTARIAAILNHLEEEGLITRSVDPQDNRQIIVALTAGGLELVRRWREEILESTAKMLEQLGPEDAREYIRLQRKVMTIRAAMAV